MPKRKDIKKILVVGAGPIIIGQACEFDYSGTQACKALKDEGYKVILINSNPATIMTDPGVADKTYVEPITIEILEKILIKEKPDAILPTMGGQTALNLAINAEKIGLLKKYKIELIGANSKAISNAEDRKKFRKNMSDIGLNLPKSEIVNNIKQIKKSLSKVGLPAIIRPAFTLGGLGSGIAKTKKDFLICLILLTISDFGRFNPISIIFFLNFFLSSALEIAFEFAPISSILYFLSNPIFSAFIAKFRAVCPPIVGKIASGFSFTKIFSKISIVIGSM